MNQKPAFLALSGLILIGIGISALFGIPLLILEEVYKRLELVDGSEAYKIWKDIPLPIYHKFYFFNVTNGVEIERLGAKPVVEEIGPFTYRTYLRKDEINFNKNGTVSYKENKSWQFQPQLSYGPDTQIITTLNAPLAFTLTLLQSATPTVRVIVTLALDAVTEGFFIRRSVKQLLFNGYPDLLTTFGPLLNPEIPSNNNGRFGYYYPKNNTNDGIFNVFTGETGIEHLNLIDRYKGRTHLSYWTTPDCNSLAGTTNGELRPPLKDGENRVVMFNPEVCRTLPLNYQRAVTKFGSLKARRFTLDGNVFKNKNDYPPNGCYITKLPRTPPPLFILPRNVNPALRGLPLPSGVFDLSACRYGVPLFVSRPHFLEADPYYLSTIDGLSPNRSAHDFYMDIDPVTGSTVGLSAKLQVNVQINKSPGLFRYRNVPEIVFPVFWQAFEIDLTEDIANNLKTASDLPTLVASITCYSLVTVGLLLLLAALFFALIPIYALHKAEISGKKAEDTPASSPQHDSKGILSRNLSASTDLGVDNPVPISGPL